MMAKLVDYGATTFLAVCAFMFTLAMWGWMQEQLAENPIAPIEWYGVEVVTPEVRVGESLKLIYEAKVNKQCPAEIRAFLSSHPDGPTARRWVTQGGYTKITPGRGKLPVTIQILDDTSGLFPPLRPGVYEYSTTVIRFCPGGLTIDNNVPSATFKIVE